MRVIGYWGGRAAPVIGWELLVIGALNPRSGIDELTAPCPG